MTESYQPGADPKRIFNLFRNRTRESLVLAVPEGCAVPGFVTDEGWAYSGTVSSPTLAPAGFDRQAAAVGARYSGFYLFQELA